MKHSILFYINRGKRFDYEPFSILERSFFLFRSDKEVNSYRQKIFLRILNFIFIRSKCKI